MSNIFQFGLVVETERSTEEDRLCARACALVVGGAETREKISQTVLRSFLRITTLVSEFKQYL